MTVSRGKKILHFHSEKTGKYQNIEHAVKFTDLIPVPFNSKSSGALEGIDVFDEVKKIIKAKPKASKKNNPPQKNHFEITYTYDTSDDESEEEDNTRDNLSEDVIHTNQVTPTTNETPTETSDDDNVSTPLHDNKTGTIPKLLFSKKGKTWTLSNKREQR